MKQEKNLLLDEVQRQITQSGAFIITQYEKLTANKANEFRRQLQKLGSGFEVVRKRMFLKAAERIGIHFTAEAVKGHIAIVLPSVDPIEVTKAIIRYSSDNEDLFTLTGGYLDGRVISSQGMKRLATLPGKDQLRAELLQLFVTPLVDTVSVMDTLLTSVVHCMANRVSKEV